ncbi:hypothetical protein [Pseudarthrobacter sp. 1C304]|uniref:hypothetical protein n=1 Tax=Pseudarthrobacter sp. 1C304 TaxID=3457438 RepID=UPI003FD50FD6
MDMVLFPRSSKLAAFSLMAVSLLVAPAVAQAGDETAGTTSTALSYVPTDYSLKYADEFNGTAVNANDWYYRITGPYAAGYMTSESVSTSGGSLRLDYTRDRDINGDGTLDYESGGLISRKQFGYGYYETRAKLFDTTNGLHTSFWSMGLRKDIAGAAGDPRINADIAAATAPEYNQVFEIDGFEHDSNQRMNMGNYKQSEGVTQVKSPYYTESTLGIDFAAWNTYAYEWTPTSLTFFINGQQVHYIDQTVSGHSFSPMNHWLTALPYSANNNPAALPGQVEFDYFRFYAKPQTGNHYLGNSHFDTRPINSYPGLHLVPGWIENGDRAASNLVTDDVHAGTRALRLGSDSPFTITTKQNLEFLPNGTYTLSARVKSGGGQDYNLLRVLNHGSTEQIVTIPTTSTWTQITIPNVQVTNGKATVALSAKGSGGQWTLIDTMSFTRD